MDYYKLNKKSVLKELNSNLNGLKNSEVNKRRKKFGLNELEQKKKVSALKIFFDQFKNPLILILIIVAIILIFLPSEDSSKLIDAPLILIIVIAIAIFGFVQDYKAEKSIEKLKKLASPKAIVIRNNKQQEIDAKEILPGDIILLEQGYQVPADARVLESINLALDESILTGESSQVDKTDSIIKKTVSLAERKNMVYTSTIVSRGRGKAIVTCIGMNTEIGKIASQIQETPEEKTQFQVEVNGLAKKISYSILGIILIIALVQYLTLSLGYMEIFLSAIALAVAAIPEGLPAVIVFALALGTRRMLKRKSLVRRLPVIQDLGSVDVICTDKTGTLTEDLMTVRKIYFNNDFIEVTGSGHSSQGDFLLNKKNIAKKLEPILKVGLLCNNASYSKKYFGDPTEIALLVIARKSGLEKEKLNKLYPRIREIPFSSERKLMTTVHKYKNQNIAFMKGAPEYVIKKCNRIFLNGKVQKLNAKKKKELLEKNAEMGRGALRVLAFAYKPLKDNSYENNLIFLGLQGMIDSPRKTVKKSIKLCRKAGIRIVMITGDNLLTAKAIAKEIGLNTNAVEGTYIDRLSDSRLKKVVEKIDIFARTSPKHKVRILNALQENNHVVAMTGDGVNDAPALKKADVGISMGVKGTDVAKETSDIILLDDNFSTIVEAVKQGRTIFDNIRKFVNYLLTSNFAEVFTVFIASLLGFLPVTYLQLLWINILTDGGPALALGKDPPVPGIMQRKPKPINERVINKNIAYLIGSIGVLLTVLLLAVFFIGLKLFDLKIAMTMTFTGFVLYEFVRVAVIRHQEKINFFSNKLLVITLIGALVLQLILIYTKLGIYFKVVPLGLMSWLVLIAGGIIAWFLAVLITKLVVRTT
jgi:Ca2+-transporting ATPase